MSARRTVAQASFTPEEFAARYPQGHPIRTMVDKLRARSAAGTTFDTYARISVAEDGDVEKTERQTLDILTAMVARKDARLGMIHVDDNKSAWKRDRKRPGWDGLLDRIESGATRGAFVWHVDRLMRQPFDLEKLINLSTTGTQLASYTGDHDLSNADHRFQLRILVAAACKASDDTSRRAKRKNAARREAGHTDGSRCFGHGGVDDDLRLREREAIAWAIQSIVDGSSWAQVAAEINARGLTSRNGLPFDPLKMRDVLIRPRHAGLLVYEGKIVGRLVDVEPIVSRALWDEFTAVLAARAIGRPRSVHTYLLSGILRCAECGRAMRGNATKGGSTELIRSYRCPVGGCCRVHVNAALAEQIAQEMTLARLAEPDHSAMIARRSEALHAVEEKISTMRARKSALVAKIAAWDADVDDIDAAMRTFNGKLSELETERARLIEEGADSAQRLPADEAYLTARWESGTPEERRGLVLAAFAYGLECTLPPVRNAKANEETVRSRIFAIRPSTEKETSQ